MQPEKTRFWTFLKKSFATGVCVTCSLFATFALALMSTAASVMLSLSNIS